MDHKVLPRKEWLESRKELLQKEKDFTKLRDELTQQTSVFYKDDEGNIFHTYSTYARGIDMMNNTYQFLDLVPKGRQDDLGLFHSDQYVPKV